MWSGGAVAFEVTRRDGKAEEGVGVGGVRGLMMIARVSEPLLLCESPTQM